MDPWSQYYFAKGTQGRADYSRSLKQEAQEIIEELGPQMLSSQQLGTLRATSVKRGASKAVSVVLRSPSRQRVTLQSVARGTDPITLRSVAREEEPGGSSFALVPKRARPTTRLLHQEDDGKRSRLPMLEYFKTLPKGMNNKFIYREFAKQSESPGSRNRSKRLRLPFQ